MRQKGGKTHEKIVHFNSRTSCEVRRRPPEPVQHRGLISTHAPLARCDATPRYFVRGTGDFNSRTSCEVRQVHHRPVNHRYNFNSRTSCEVRRRSITHMPRPQLYFNSRTSCEVRPRALGIDGPPPEFQLTHLLRGATRSAGRSLMKPKFQLTHLLRGATAAPAPHAPSPDFNSRTSCEVRHPSRICFERGLPISTHAPLARCDPGGRREGE